MRKTDNLPPSCAVVTKFGNLNFLESSGPLRSCKGTSLKHFLYPDPKIHETTTALFFPCNSQDSAYFCIYNMFQFRCSNSVIIETKLRLGRLIDHGFITVMGQVFLCFPECFGAFQNVWSPPNPRLRWWCGPDLPRKVSHWAACLKSPSVNPLNTELNPICQ